MPFPGKRKVANTTPRNQLTPRERVLLALAHRDTDRAPVDFLATPEAWAQLEDHLGIHDREAVLSHLGVDVRHPRQPYIGPPLKRKSDGTWIDAWGVRRRRVRHDRGAYEEIVEHPLARIEDASELEHYAWPQPEWWDAAGLAAEIRSLDVRGDDARGDYAIARNSAILAAYSRSRGTCGAWSSS